MGYKLYGALVLSICLLLFLCVVSLDSYQNAQAAESVKAKYQYAAKVICSLLTPHQDGTLASGTYRTVVNIHNPTDKKITFAHKVALATQLGSPPGEFSVTPFKEVSLGPDGAVQVSCFNISNFFCPINGICVDFAFLDGFLVINTPVELDVVSVYSARHNNGEVETMEVEYIDPRKISKVIKLESDNGTSEIKKRIKYPEDSAQTGGQN